MQLFGASFRGIRKLGMSLRKILVVDDFQPWHRFVLQMFESVGDSNIIHFAADGLEAIEKAAELQPDVILMDIGLPLIDGIEAARRIRVLSPSSKILFLSEHRSHDYIQAAFDAGGSGYILKSDSNWDLIPGVQAAMAGEQFISRSIRDWPNSSDSVD